MLSRFKIEHTPVAWQEIAGQRVPVSVRYTLAANQRVGFEVGQYDASQPLVLDPTFSTYLGGSGVEEAQDVAVDVVGNVYVTGSTNSTLFPTLNPAQGANGGNYDAFVAKYNVSGVKIYATYFGGDGGDIGQGIAVDTTGDVYVTGETYSTNLATRPATPIQTTLSGFNDAFVIRLNSQGNTLVYSTYLGGDGGDYGYGIAVESISHTAYVTGATTSNNLPNAQNTRTNYQDAFIVRINEPGTSVLYSRYHGGNDNDSGYDIAVDSNASAYVTGLTWSSVFPTLSPTGSAYQTSKGGGSFDAFVAKFDGSGTPVYSTYLGGNGSDSGEGIAVVQGNAYITGYTGSSNFPGTNANSLQSGCGDSPCNDAFVAKLDSNGATLPYSTYLGGTNYDYGTSIAVTSAGIAFVAGYTQSGNFPTKSPFQASLKGNEDAFVAVIDPSLPAAEALRYSTYLGGSSIDQANGIALDPNASIYVVGSTSSNDFPTFNQYQNYASYDAFVAKLSDTIGFEDFSAGAAGGDATADKPQSKLWWNDGIWWAVMFSTTDNKYQIYKLNWPDKWVRTPAAIDDRPTSRADALWDDVSKKLYIVSIVSVQPDQTAPTPPNDEARNYRYSYNSTTKTYTLDAGFPHVIMYGQTESMTIAKDGVGNLWVAYTQNLQVKYQVSVNDGASWGGANPIPGVANVFADDIASVVAFDGKIGVMWSRHDPDLPAPDPDAAIYFSYHTDGTPDNTWSSPEPVYAGPCLSDDHITIKAPADSSGKLFAVIKTSLEDENCGNKNNANNNQSQLLLAVRAANGTWSTTEYGKVMDDHTRPALLLDSVNRTLYVFAASPTVDGGTIYMKSTSMDNPSFALQPGLGRPIINSPTNANLNNVTTTKQSLNGTTDLVVLATDEVTKKYMHNVIDLPGQAPPPPVTNLLINGSFELDANADGRPDSWGSNSKFTRSTAIPAIDGSYIGRFFATDNSGTTMFQQLTGLTAGTSYSVAGKVNIPATSDSFTFKLEVKWYTAGGSTISTSNVKTYSAATAGWDSAGATLVAPANATTADMRMNVSSLNATIYVDNLTFSAGAPPPDTTPPTVTSTTPANGATSVQVGQNAVAVFSEAVSGVGPSSFTLTPQGGSALATTVTYDAASTTAALDPNVDLLPNTTYTAHLTAGITDLAGNALTPVSWSFTTAAAADTTPPTVISKTPAAGATGVAPATNITAQFSEAVTGVSPTSFTLVPQAGGAALAATVSYDPATKTATLNPTADLAATTSYTAQLSGVITDAANNGMLPVSWSFTTGAAGGTFSFGADADTYVSQEFPGNNYATNSQLQAVGGSSTAKQAFLRFTVTGLAAGAGISSAKLRLYVTNDSTSGGMFNRITNTTWAETITWGSKPAIDGPLLATLGAAAINTFVDVDITAAITGNGTYSFAITLPTANTNTLAYASKEASTVANRPQLIVTTQ